jgi:YD repeat-containing protein
MTNATQTNVAAGGDTVSYDFNAQGQATSITAQDAAGTQTSKYEFAYWPSGRLHSVTYTDAGGNVTVTDYPDTP